jgi:hypothetical protein
MKLFIHCDAKGDILSAVKVQEAGAEYHPFAHVEESDHIVKTEINAELKALFAHEISEQYQVDLESRRLKKKAASTVVKEATKKSRKSRPEHRGR